MQVIGILLSITIVMHPPQHYWKPWVLNGKHQMEIDILDQVSEYHKKINHISDKSDKYMNIIRSFPCLKEININKEYNINNNIYIYDISYYKFMDLSAANKYYNDNYIGFNIDLFKEKYESEINDIHIKKKFFKFSIRKTDDHWVDGGYVIEYSVPMQYTENGKHGYARAIWKILVNYDKKTRKINGIEVSKNILM